MTKKESKKMKFLKNKFRIFALLFILTMSNDSGAQMFWNQTCQFAGTNTSYVSVPSTAGTDITGDFTAQTWVNPTSVTGSERGIIAKGSVLGVSMRYAVRINTTGKVTVYTNGVLRLTSAATLAINSWTHVTATFSAATDSFAIYINGVKNIAAVVGGVEPSSNTDSLYIGIAGSGINYIGQMDEVRLWNRALTLTEITQNFRTSLGTSSGLYSALVFSLPFQNRHSGGTQFSTIDWTGNGNNGTGRNVTAVSQTNNQYTTISANECLNFLGSKEYAAGQSNSLVSPSSQITLEAWVFPKSYTNSPTIISKNSSTSYKLNLGTTGKVEFVPKGGASIAVSNAVIAQNRWTHIAATYNGSATRIYVNGVLDTTDTSISGAIGTNSDSLFIGCDNTTGSTTKYFNGYIDEVRIANYVKTNDQIKNYMYRSIDSVNQPNAASNNVSYNFDGTTVDNADGGPRLFLRNNTIFSHVGGISNQPVSPLLRSDSRNFSEGYNIRTSNKRLPLTGGTGTVDDSLMIPFNVNINDINVFVAIHHTDETNLDVSLIAPNGEIVELSTDNVTAGAYDNLITIFDDQAVNIVTNTTYTSFLPAIRPEVNMFNTFGGDYTQGIWRLRVVDDGGTADTGRLVAWGIQFNTSPFAARVSSLNLTSIIQGFWDGVSMVQDTMRVYLRNTTAPYAITDSSKVFLSSSGNSIISFLNTGNETKYITLKHRNSLDTWSAAGVAFKIDSTVTYNFTTAANRAYGNNLALKGGKYCVYNGNVNGDIGIDLADVIAVFNAGSVFTVGYVKTDVTGDNFVDLTDALAAYNNASVFAATITPP
jgi:subtilisin-like proprotein convertase family protein